MVRGVNKKVVEIVGGKEDCFERAIVIVKSSRLGLSDLQLHRQAGGAITGMVSCRPRRDWRWLLRTGVRYLAVLAAGAGLGWLLLH